MRHIENLIFVILILCLVICTLLLRQISRFHLPRSSKVMFSVDLRFQSSLGSKLLFNMGSEFQSDLDNGNLSEALWQQFADKKISLSNNAIVSTEEQGSIWRITDHNQTYTLIKKGDKLNIYNSIKVPDAFRVEFNKNNKPPNKDLLSPNSTIATIEPSSRWRITSPDLNKQYDIRAEGGKLNVYRAVDLDTLPSVLSLVQMPPADLPQGRDVFQLPWRKKDTVRLPVLPEKKAPILSTIVWSEAEPLAVIDGEILALGKMDKKSQFRVETITRDYVQIRLIEDKKLLTLTLPPGRPEELGTPMAPIGVKQVESTQTEEN